MWGLSPTDNNSQINNFKAAQSITNPCAGTQGGGPAAIEITIEGQNFLGYPTYCVVCPDRTLYFDVCYPPSVPCFDPYFELCAQTTLMAQFTADATEICVENSIHFTDMSIGDVKDWNWTFEGGDPSTSTEQNPTVIYHDPGQWDVELTVSDGINTNTMLLQDYIGVSSLPEVMLEPFDDACLNWPPFELTGGSPVGGVYAGPGVEDGWFYPEIAGTGTHPITYTYTNELDCSDFAEETLYVDPCVGIASPGNNTIRIYPNPTDGILYLNMNYSGEVFIRIIDLLGVTIWSKDITVSDQINTMLNLKNLRSGLYFVTIRTDQDLFVRKIKLIN